MGMLAKLAPSNAMVDTLLYTVPTGKHAVVNLSALNRTEAGVSFSASVVEKLDMAVSSVAVTKKGGGFTAIPSLVFEGQNTTQATVSVASMSVTSASINLPGSGYLVGDVLTLEVADSTASIKAKVVVTQTGFSGTILAFNIIEGGVYTVLGGAATVTGGTGIGATFTAIKFGINAVTLIEPGNGYKAVPTIAYTGGSGVEFSVQMKQIPEINDYIEYNLLVTPSNVIERNGLCLSEGQSVFIRADTANAMNAHIRGFEKLA